MARNDDYFDLIAKLAKQPSYDACIKVVYQWVKNGYISYRMMGDLTQHLYQKYSLDDMFEKFRS